MAESKWQKSPPELIALFDEIAPIPPGERRVMFGYPTATLGGNMFMGLFRDRFNFRLNEGDRKKLIEAGGRVFEPMAGRPMREYVVPPAEMHADRAKLREWAARSLAYAKTMPPKKSKAVAKKKSTLKKS